MKFLVDAQLPPALARFLASLGEEAIHVLDVGLIVPFGSLRLKTIGSLLLKTR